MLVPQPLPELTRLETFYFDGDAIQQSILIPSQVEMPRFDSKSKTLNDKNF